MSVAVTDQYCRRPQKQTKRFDVLFQRNLVPVVEKTSLLVDGSSLLSALLNIIAVTRLHLFLSYNLKKQRTMVEEKGRTLPAPPEVEVDITPSAPLPEEEAQPQNRRDDYQHPQLPESVHDITYHPGEIVFYRPVKQRQKWGDSQILPR